MICLYIRELLLYVKNSLDLYEKRNDYHKYSIRHNHALNLASVRLNKTSSSFQIMAIKVANKFPCLNYAYIHLFQKLHIKILFY
ncbi:hypothetical protein C0J52_08383 [Blattella germanica]|nr:hypothetical protein C0J52_08383 [Blattella germanica]